MKALLTLLLVVLTIPLLGFGWYVWDSAKNRGFTFGYFGELNSVEIALREIPELAVLSSGANEDVILEEMWFELEMGDSDRIRLFFGENDPIRELQGEELSDALAQMIEKQRFEKSQR